MTTYTSAMRRSMGEISFMDDDFIEKIIDAGKHFRPFSEAMDDFIIHHGYDGSMSGLAGIARSHLVELENGKKTVKLNTLWNIAYALDLKPSELISLVEKEVGV